MVGHLLFWHFTETTEESVKTPFKGIFEGRKKATSPGQTLSKKSQF